MLDFCNSLMVSTILFPISSNSFLPKPLVVQAGVPNLTPDVMVGFCGSFGTAFLLQIIWYFSCNLCSNARPVMPFDLKSSKTI